MHSTHDAFGLWQTEKETWNTDQIQERINVGELILSEQSTVIIKKNLQIWIVS